ncbi:MAG: 50S ribosomal protein L29 [Patescibacteria group bacterium]|jgi:large subunit ribosomal protein L29|nr:50S ribosomal protein L29 [Patescibacteria group bacterium]MDD5172919.1 50S ribosomal protein L29 [Patescibacteria group bacterium]
MKMKIKELKQKSKQELEKLLREIKENLRFLNFDLQLKQSKNVREIRKSKKLIAKILTIINQK